MPLLLDLFLTFAKIGLFTFGGGYAMISIIDDACVEKKKWITAEEMMNITVIAESTPGPVAINCATFVGYKQRGVLGALIATLGMAMPSFVIIYLISLFLDNFLEIVWVANAFSAIKIAVGILILDAGIKMLKKMKKTAFRVTILVLSTLLLLCINAFSLRFSTISMLLIAGMVSVSPYALRGMDRKEGPKE